MSYTNLRNLNRGFMKLEVWNDSIGLLKRTSEILDLHPHLDFKLKSQIINATQSISANISEGYCRRTIKEYLQFLNVALGSAGEAITRMIGLHVMGLIPKEELSQFDTAHFAAENKLLSLVRSLQKMKRNNQWQEELPE